MRTLPLGLACVAAAMKKAGYDVELLDLMEEENPQESLANQPEASAQNLQLQTDPSNSQLTAKSSS
jgi:hypothetical protein